MKDIPIKVHYFTFNDECNGGESLVLITEFYSDEDGVLHTNQKIVLQSYFNSASLNLGDESITPSKLRDLANQLEAEYNKICEG